MEDNKDAQTLPHSLTLDGRSRARLTGILSVSCFDDHEVVLETSEGELAIIGDALHIEQLNLTDSRLDVTGRISAVEYSELSPKKERRGLFLRRKK